MAAPGSRQVMTQRSGLPSKLETHCETSASRADARSLERAGWLLTIRTKGIAEDLPIDSRNQSTSSSAARSAVDGERMTTVGQLALLFRDSVVCGSNSQCLHGNQRSVVTA